MIHVVVVVVVVAAAAAAVTVVLVMGMVVRQNCGVIFLTGLNGTRMCLLRLRRGRRRAWARCIAECGVWRGVRCGSDFWTM